MVTGALSPFVGRGAELAELTAALEEAAGGTGRCVVVGGEAGVGKSRLLAEGQAYARTLGFSVFEGTSFPFDATIPLSPFADLLRAALRGRQPAELAEELGSLAGDLASVLPELAVRLPGTTGDARPTPEPEKQRLFGAITTCLLRQADAAPALLVLEDLHWADDVSLELFVVLARQLSGRRVVLLGTYRSDEAGTPLDSAIAQLRRSHVAGMVELPAFTPGETADFVGHLLGGRRLRADALDELYALTEGNPFFIEEVVKSLGSSGAGLAQDSGATRLPLSVVGPPSSIREAVRRRLSLLSEPACQLLTVAAVAGRRFEFEVLERVTGIDEPGLIAILHELVDANLVREESADRFAFRHALTRQAVLSTMLGRERQQLHARVAAAVAAGGSQLAPDPSDLAYHYFEAGEWVPAADYARLAGQRALSMFSPRAAAQEFARAEKALAVLGVDADFDLLWSGAHAYDTLGEFEPARAWYERAAAQARTGADADQEWQALIDLGLLWAARDYQQARRCFEDCLVLARACDDPALLARTLNRLANVAVNEERLDDAFDLHGQALAIAEELGDRRQIAECHDLMGMASFQAGELARAEAHYEQAVGAFHDVDDRYGLSSALAVRALCAGANLTETEPDSHREAADQQADAERSLALAQESGWRAGEAFALAVQAWVLTPRGEYAAALHAAERGLQLAEEIEHRQWTAAGCCALGRLYADVLAYEPAREYLERGYALGHELGSPLWICNIGGSLVELCAGAGDLDRAHIVMEEVERHIGPSRTLHGRTGMAARAALALAGGRAPAALETLDRLSSAQVALRAKVPLLLRLRAEALLVSGRWDGAEQFAMAAREAAAARGRLPQLWRCDLVLARLYAASGRRAMSREAFARVRATTAALAESLERPELRETFLRRTGALLPPERPATDLQSAKLAYDGLTAREREVATLVARGLGNREIASHLTVSERTVEAHISNVLAKLEFTSRAQVAAWAVEKGLA
jgi:DNA-binding CsgD family transcriptional regulator